MNKKSLCKSTFICLYLVRRNDSTFPWSFWWRRNGGGVKVEHDKRTMSAVRAVCPWTTKGRTCSWKNTIRTDQGGKKNSESQSRRRLSGRDYWGHLLSEREKIKNSVEGKEISQRYQTLINRITEQIIGGKGDLSFIVNESPLRP